MMLCHSWYTDLGVNVPDHYGDLCLHNYFEIWNKDKKGLLEKMIELFKTLGEQVDSDKIQRHDLLVVEEKENLYAAICLGGGLAITSNINEGVRVFHTGKLHKVVLARRLI